MKNDVTTDEADNLFSNKELFLKDVDYSFRVQPSYKKSLDILNGKTNAPRIGNFKLINKNLNKNNFLNEEKKINFYNSFIQINFIDFIFKKISDYLNIFINIFY